MDQVSHYGRGTTLPDLAHFLTHSIEAFDKMDYMINIPLIIGLTEIRVFCTLAYPLKIRTKEALYIIII